MYDRLTTLPFHVGSGCGECWLTASFCLIFVPLYRFTYRRWSRGRPIGTRSSPQCQRGCSFFRAFGKHSECHVFQKFGRFFCSIHDLLVFFHRFWHDIVELPFFLRQHTHLCPDVKIFPTFWCCCICGVFQMLERVFERRDEIRYDFQCLCDVGNKNDSILGEKRTCRGNTYPGGG